MAAVMIPQNEDLVAREVLHDVLDPLLRPLKEYIAKVNESVIAFDRFSPIAKNSLIHFFHIGISAGVEEGAITVADDIFMAKLKMSVGPNPNITHF